VWAMGLADDPDEVVTSTPWPIRPRKTGWSTPAESVWSQRRLGHLVAAPMKAGARSGNVSVLKKAISTVASSSSVSGLRRTSRSWSGAMAQRSVPYRDATWAETRMARDTVADGTAGPPSRVPGACAQIGRWRRMSFPDTERGTDATTSTLLGHL
jgi:hypothetical protein